VQDVKVGATRDGSLVAIDHESIEPLSMEDFFAEPVTPTTAKLYGLLARVNAGSAGTTECGRSLVDARAG